jgi:hypothetical protein
MIFQHGGILLFAAFLSAAEPDPLVVRERAVAKVLAGMRNVPKYTCVETVERDYFQNAEAASAQACASKADFNGDRSQLPPPERLAESDRLRLEVTLAEQGEIFSWVGAQKFEEAGIDRVVRSGSIGSGAFAGLLSSVFREDGKRLTFRGQADHDGRLVLEYSYDIAAAESEYRVKVFMPRAQWRKTAYRGTVQIDSETADVVRVSAQTAELPAEAGNCRTLTSIDFGNVKLGGGQVLLPVRAVQHFVTASGQDTVNTITFAGCREYRVEAKVAFDDPDEALGKAIAAHSQLRTLPAGLWFMMDLTSPIHSSTAAAGDPFIARLAETLYEGGVVLASKGSEVGGRLLRVEMDVMHAQVILVLKPETIETRKGRVLVNAALRWKQKQGEVILPRDGEEGSGAFTFRGYTAEVHKGFRTAWRTIGPPSR